jgi:rhamnosyltransferase
MGSDGSTKIRFEMKVFALVVSYNGDWEHVTHMVGGLTRAGIAYVIVDNGSANPAPLEKLNTIFLGENLGIAAAQNAGIQHCLEQGAGIVVFFDQDSVIEADFVEALVGPVIDGRTKIAAPVFFDSKQGFAYPIVRFSKYGFRTKFDPLQMDGPLITNVVISSGTAVAVDVFAVAGVMNAAMFIDYVDTEWCLRCFAHGYTVRVDPQVTMRHSIGDRTISLGRFKVPIHSSLRRYYRIRNSFMLLRLAHVPKLLALREIAFSVIHQLLILMVVSPRTPYVTIALRALWHGLRNRSGRL